MSPNIGWGNIAVRPALTLLAGAVIGFNRGERHQQVGLRTTMLVCLAGSVTMILVNVLFPAVHQPEGHQPEGLFRLPQGLLSGIGFIGAGAIVRRGRLVEGVTTAATLWFVTVIGMCFGAGYLGLGAASSGIAALILWCLKWVERRIGIARQARLIVAFETGSGIENRVIAALAHAGYKIAAESRSLPANGEFCEICYQLRWYDDGRAALTPGFTDDLARERGVQRLEWKPARID